VVGLGDDGFDRVALLVVDFEPASHRQLGSHGSDLRLAATGWHFGWDTPVLIFGSGEAVIPAG